MLIKKKQVFVVAGPTGVGKSDTAVAMALACNGEIINADMGQLYTPLTIGTAKPDWRAAPVPHHLFDVVNEPRDVTVADYRHWLLETMATIHERGAQPIVVGGSHFYLYSMFYPPRGPAAPPLDDTPGSYKSAQDLWQELARIDPVRARAIHPNDIYRIRRALAIWQTTGTKPSEHEPLFEPPCSFTLYIYMRERHELYARIDQRVKLMMAQGWIDEVRALLGTPWEKFLLRKKIIGYDDIIRYLHNDYSYEYLIELIAKKTRNYAKRQCTFLRSLQEKIERSLIQEPRVHDQEITSTIKTVYL